MNGRINYQKPEDNPWRGFLYVFAFVVVIFLCALVLPSLEKEIDGSKKIGRMEVGKSFMELRSSTLSEKGIVRVRVNKYITSASAVIFSDIGFSPNFPFSFCLAKTEEIGCAPLFLEKEEKGYKKGDYVSVSVFEFEENQFGGTMAGYSKFAFLE